MITNTDARIRVPMYIFISMHILTVPAFRNFELCGIETAITKVSSRLHNLYLKQPSPMATYQDGHIWQKTSNAYPKRPNPRDCSGEKTGDKRVHVLDDSSRGAHKTSCP